MKFFMLPRFVLGVCVFVYSLVVKLVFHFYFKS